MHHTPRRRFGQNFLVDSQVIADIVHAIHPAKNNLLVEIGPGLGALTQPLLRLLNHLHVIEIDYDIVERLHQKFTEKELTIYLASALEFDFSTLGKNLRVVGNLPYNISTPILFHLSKFATYIDDMHFMLQKEVVDRITATPAHSTYSRLSVMMQSYYKVEKLFDITPDKFSPPPKVISSFMRLIPSELSQNKITNREFFNKVVELSFQQRRKTIKNNLVSIATEAQLQQASINPSQRPQEISIEQFITLSNQLAN